MEDIPTTGLDTDLNSSIVALEEEMNGATFWNNKDHAQEVIKKIKP